MPTSEQSVVPERVMAPAAGLNLSSITPMSADQIIDGGPASSAKVQRAMQGFAGSGGGGGSGTTHTVHFTVNDEDVGTVQGDDDFAKRLANVLQGAAGSVTGR